MKEALAEWARRSGMTEFALKFAIGVAKYTSDRPVDETIKLAEQRMHLDKRSSEAEEKERRQAATVASGPQAD